MDNNLEDDEIYSNFEYIFYFKGDSNIDSLCESERDMLHESKKMLVTNTNVLNIARKYYVDNISPSYISKNSVYDYLLNANIDDNHALFSIDENNIIEEIDHKNENFAVVRIIDDNYTLNNSNYKFLKKIGIKSISFSKKFGNLYFFETPIPIDNIEIDSDKIDKRGVVELGITLSCMALLGTMLTRKN